MNISQTHKFVIDNTANVNNICKPLFTKLSMNYFSYGRFYDDGSFQVLVSNPLWYEHFWKNNYKLSTPKHSNFLKKEFILYIWEDSLQKKLVKDAKEYFHMDNGLTLIRRVPRYFEYFSYAFSNNDKISITSCLNNLKFLESFGKFFLDKAYSIISLGEKNRIYLDNTEPKYINIPSLEFSDENIFQNKKDIIYNINFSIRELDCIHLLKKNFTVKKIAKELYLSPRTVEDYIVAIRRKLECQKKSDIILRLESIQRN